MVARLALPESSSQLASRFSCGPPDTDAASHDQFQDLHGASGVGPHNGISLEQLYMSFFGAVGLVACQGVVAQCFLHPFRPAAVSQLAPRVGLRPAVGAGLPGLSKIEVAQVEQPPCLNVGKDICQIIPYILVLADTPAIRLLGGAMVQ